MSAIVVVGLVLAALLAAKPAPRRPRQLHLAEASVVEWVDHAGRQWLAVRDEARVRVVSLADLG